MKTETLTKQEAIEAITKGKAYTTLVGTMTAQVNIKALHLGGDDRKAATAYGIYPLEAEQNARLIAEAFNVYNETGLTPRKLLEDRNILIDITKDSMERMIKSLPTKELNTLIETLKTFINDSTK